MPTSRKSPKCKCVNNNDGVNNYLLLDNDKDNGILLMGIVTCANNYN